METLWYTFIITQKSATYKKDGDSDVGCRQVH